MLTEMTEYSSKVKEEVKTIQTEIKQNTQGTNNEGTETGIKSMIWNERKKETFNQNRIKKQEFKKIKQNKIRRGEGTSRTTLNGPTSES